MKNLITGILVFVFMTVFAQTARCSFYDDFSTDPNTNWTTTVTGSDTLDLNAYGKYSYPPYAYLAHSGSNTCEMKRSFTPTGQYRVSFDFLYGYGSSSCWAERVAIGTDTNNIRIDLFPYNRGSGGYYFFVKTITSQGATTQLESTVNTSGWDHYDLLIDTGVGQVVFRRWDRDNDLDADPAGYYYKPDGEVIDSATFNFTFDTSGNEFKRWNSSSGSAYAETALDNVWMGQIPEPATIGLIAIGSLIAVFRRQQCQ